MRYGKAHKPEVRRRIVTKAAAALRTHGLQGLSIPALMKRAGLTHGGFYAHFGDRDELVAEAIAAAADETRRSVFAPAPGLAEVLDAYLSLEHVRRPEHGCVLAALGTDAVRQRSRVRHAFMAAAEGLLRLLEDKRRQPLLPREVSDETLARASTIVGAVVLARILADSPLAERTLAAARRQASGRTRHAGPARTRRKE